MNGHVDAAAAHDVAASYTDTPTTRDPLVAAAYDRLITESDQLFRHLTSPDRPDRVHIAFTTCPAPCANALELISSVRYNRLLEVTTVATKHDRHHPLMGNDPGRGLRPIPRRPRRCRPRPPPAQVRPRQKFAAWRSQECFHSPLARQALATELHGQHSVLWTTGELAQPNAILLDPRLLRRSVTTALRPTTPTKGSSGNSS